MGVFLSAWFTAVEGYPASKSKILHLANLVQYMLMERKQLLCAYCSKGNVIYEGRMCIWGSQHFKRHNGPELWMVPSQKKHNTSSLTHHSFHSLLLSHRTGTCLVSMTYINKCVWKFNPLRNLISSEPQAAAGTNNELLNTSFFCSAFYWFY